MDINNKSRLQGKISLEMLLFTLEMVIDEYLFSLNQACVGYLVHIGPHQVVRP